MLNIKDVTKTYGNITAVDHLNLNVEDGAFWTSWPQWGWKNHFDPDDQYIDTDDIQSYWRLTVSPWTEIWWKLRKGLAWFLSTAAWNRR